ncbi:helix-turn-helix domain-containing protein [Bacillus spongiae]|uniref:Helix-turn-helix domain-containing protein n=1 Tax=Bacillus spongiae TaxID=2683610 RepID=A0ABU8HJJ0_9BACI
MESLVEQGKKTIYYENVYVFGQKLKSLRKKRKLSIKAFSKKIGWGYWCVERWEKGDPVGPNTLNMLAEFFNVSPDYLLSANEQLTLF